ncbi:MAG TPA: hypothetical protein PK156_21890 [Polyangium sp.]|nr:hypothetical protein [Polyangium sp.]
MSVHDSRHLLDQLRDLEHHYAQQQPARDAEMRLMSRLRTNTSRSPRIAQLSWNHVKRPLLILAACVVILAASVHDEIRRVGRIHLRPAWPNLPAASTNPLPPPAPKSRQERPRYHDSMTPMPPRAPEPPKTIDPSAPIAITLSPDQGELDASWPPDAPRTRTREFNYWNSPEKPRKTNFFDTPSTQWYWPGTRTTKPESYLPSSGGSSRTTNTPTKPEATPKPPKPVVCQSADVLKKAAYVDCSDQGLTLADFSLLEPCENGLYSGEMHECTEVETDPDGCITDTVGDGKTCMDPGWLKTVAYESCNAAGQQLTDLVFDFGTCNGMAVTATYTCCTPDVPANTPTCHETMSPNNQGSCRDSGLMKLEASELCVAEGNYLVDYKAWGNCPPGQASSLVAICCEP